ncbi:MAG: hypothetical protein ACR2JP_02625 [Acidimicrobiia bacterium]
MRRVVAALFIALDGVTEAPGQWQDEFDEDMGVAMVEALATQDAVLLGRVTYQEWASYWPNAEVDMPFKHLINTTPKYVPSTTLQGIEREHDPHRRTRRRLRPPFAAPGRPGSSRIRTPSERVETELLRVRLGLNHQ